MVTDTDANVGSIFVQTYSALMSAIFFSLFWCLALIF